MQGYYSLDHFNLTFTSFFLVVCFFHCHFYFTVSVGLTFNFVCSFIILQM